MQRRPMVVGIAGGSCTGKTVLAAGIADRLGKDNTARLPQDCYYRDLSHLVQAERAQWNFDCPEALDHELFARHLSALAKGEAIERPCYDFTTHTRRPECEIVEPRPFVIVEGLFALYWEEIRALMDVKIFIVAEDGVCLERRIWRDKRERERTEESVKRQFASTVQPMYQQYCAPTMRFADLVVCGEDPIEVIVDRALAFIQGKQLTDG